MEKSEDEYCLICQNNHFFLRCPYSFMSHAATLHNDSPVLRRKNNTKKNRLRSRSLNPWKLYKSLK